MSRDSLPADIPEELKEFLLQDEDLTYEEVIQQQASVYQSYQESGTSRVVVTEDDDISDSSSSDESASRDESVISQEALDEAYARSLQELGEEFDEFFIPEFNGNTEIPVATQTEHEQEEEEEEQVTSSETSQDEIDPDNMRYEELLDLTETIGVENTGLSETHISQLPTSIYTSQMFSNNQEESCAICQEDFKFGKRMMTLPCFHQYHSKCITKWLKLKKNCPICQKEVV